MNVKLEKEKNDKNILFDGYIRTDVDLGRNAWTEIQRDYILFIRLKGLFHELLAFFLSNTSAKPPDS